MKGFRTLLPVNMRKMGGPSMGNHIAMLVGHGAIRARVSSLLLAAGSPQPGPSRSALHRGPVMSVV